MTPIAPPELPLRGHAVERQLDGLVSRRQRAIERNPEPLQEGASGAVLAQPDEVHVAQDLRCVLEEPRVTDRSEALAHHGRGGAAPLGRGHRLEQFEGVAREDIGYAAHAGRYHQVSTSQQRDVCSNEAPVVRVGAATRSLPTRFAGRGFASNETLD